MKKYLILLLLIPSFTHAGVLDFSKTNYYYGAGSPSPVLGATVLYPQAGGTGISSATAGELNYCLKVSNNSPLTYAFGVCGSGAGGGAGTWSTTTSSVAGRLNNYSNNTTDIVNIGGTATTTSNYYFDPNLNTAVLGRNANFIGGRVYRNGFFQTPTQVQITGHVDDLQSNLVLGNTSTGGFSTGGITFINASSTDADTFAASVNYGYLGYSGPSFNTFPGLPPSSIVLSNDNGGVVLGSLTSTTSNQLIGFALGPGYLMANYDMVLKNIDTISNTNQPNGGLGIGTTTPYARLAVSASSTASYPYFVVASTTNGVSGSNSSVFTISNNGAVGIGTNNPARKFTILSSGTDARMMIDTPDTTSNPGIEFRHNQSQIYRSLIRSDYESGSPNLTFWTSNSGTVGQSMVISGNGNIGMGTTTPGTSLSIGNTGANTSNISVTSTSTLATGINLKSGCYAVNGVCITGGGGGGVSGPVTTTLEASCEPQTDSADFAPGGAYWQPIYGWTFTNATSSRIICNVAIPKNLAATPNISIMPYLSATSSAGTGIGIVDVSATTTGMLQNWYTVNYTDIHAASTTASKRWALTMDTSLPLTSTTTITLAGFVTPAGGDILKFEITRYGADANDTVENDLFIPKVLVQLDTN